MDPTGSLAYPVYPTTISSLVMYDITYTIDCLRDLLDLDPLPGNKNLIIHVRLRARIDVGMEIRRAKHELA